MRGVSYRPPSTPPRGAWALHLHRIRQERDLSATQAFELVYERVGWSPKSRAAFVAIDQGRSQPSPEIAAVLAAEFGWPPEPGEVVETNDPLAAAILELTAELRTAREERATVEARLKEVERLVARLTERDFAASQAPQPQPRSTGSGR